MDQDDELRHDTVGEDCPTLPMERLVVLQGGRLDLLDAPGGSLQIGHQPLLVGRSKRCALRLDDPHVSLLHASLQATPDGVLVKVLGSRDNTFVGPVCVPNGREVYMTAACTVHFGFTRLRFVPGECERLRLPHEARLGRLVGRSPRMRTLFALIERYADSPLSVLIGGENGTGKELVAHAIHNASSRRNKPIVGINCARFNPNNVASELFGHVRGAFTGADQAREGAFAKADGGTLFMDEAGVMNSNVQEQLLRVFETKEVQPLGSDKTRRVDVRTIFATNANLRARINEDAFAFREDLYHRIAQLTLEVPPLRERVGDLPLLIADILAELGRPEVTLDKRAHATLAGREWSGNVRELRNVLEVAVHGFSGAVLSAQDLAFCPPKTTDRPPKGILRARVETMEREEITSLCVEYNGNVSRIAKETGYHRRVVRERLKLYGLYQEPGLARTNGSPSKVGWLERIGLPVRRTP
jgi:transcriptional regulator with AAA-type ATPase domain